MNDSPYSTIPELIDWAAVRFGDREALVDGSIRWTYNEFREQILRAGRATISSGVGHGDRVALWAPNIWEWAVTALAVHYVGGVVVPINTRFLGREAAHLLNRSQARLLFTVTDFLDTDYLALLDDALLGDALLGDVDRPPALDEIVVGRGPVPAGASSFADFLARADQTSPHELAVRSAAVRGGDLCNIMFTSGTTGAPKAAMLTHSATCRAFRSWSDVVGLDQDRYLIVNPFFHSFGLNAGILASIMTGSTIVPHPVFDVDSVMKRIPEERISMLPGPPAIFQTILNHPHLEDFDFSTLRLAVTGAAAIPVEMIIEMRERLGFEKVVTGYGLTEVTGIATMCRHDDDPEIIAKTSGRAIDGVEVRVVDPANPDNTSNEVLAGQPGEIVVRGYNVMVGYLDDPTQTAETIDGDGWLHTGDIGVMDSNGNIAITDRLKDMFINGGFNAYPAEIENLMLGHPHIGQVAVVGVCDQRLGEVGFAFVVASPDALITAASEAEIIAWCRGQMANYKAPRYIRFVSELPLNASGKVLKFELRATAELLVGRAIG